MYSREEILALSAGRELDALVAEHVFEKQVVWTFGDEWTDSYPIDEHEIIICQFSLDIMDAWEVFEWLVKRHEDTMLTYPWCVSVDYDPTRIEAWKIIVDGETAPLAICRAALLSLLKED